MARRSSRIILVLLGILITAGLGYRAISNEQALGRARLDGASVEHSADEALAVLLDLRATVHAYVAPGQGLAFWAGRSMTLLDTLRDRLLAIDTALATSGGSLADALDGVDQLTAAEKRAGAYAGRGESLMAGDVIFTEVRDLLATATGQVSAARNTLRRETDRRISEIRQEQAGLAIGAIAVWLIIAIALLPVASPVAVREPKDWRLELADRLKKPASAPEDSGELRRDLAETAFGREGGPGVPAGSVEPAVSATALKIVGEICADLSALSDGGALPGALQRAADAIGASGVIVWLASNDGDTLSPVATHGFDARLVSRIGTIRRDSSNLTAAAFRENTARVSAAHASTAAALAVSMCGPTGPVGVLSAELRQGRDADEACVAVATIFAAQLATLAFPVANPVAPASAESATEAVDDAGLRRVAR